MFVLTTEEKRVVSFVLLAVVVGLGVKEYRRLHPSQRSNPVRLEQPAKLPVSRNLTGATVISSSDTDSKQNDQ